MSEQLKIYEGDAKIHFKISRILQKYNVEQEDIDFILDEFVKFAKESEKANKIFKQFFEFYKNIVIKNDE